jgi:hypothetical protein
MKAYPYLLSDLFFWLFSLIKLLKGEGESEMRWARFLNLGPSKSLLWGRVILAVRAPEVF